MKRFLASALLIGAVSGLGLVGCGETAKETHVDKVSTPDGSVTTKTEKSTTATGNATSTDAAAPAK